MPTEPELLQAVLKNPDDDAPRLEYAKWCEAQVEPALRARASFIREQIQLVRQPPADAFAARELRTAAEHKLAQFHRAWTANLPPGALDLQFRRGFVERIVLNDTGLADQIPRWQSLVPCRHVDFVKHSGPLARLIDLPAWERVRSLSLARCGLVDDDARELARSVRFGALRWLSLAANELTMDGIAALADSRLFPELRYLSLHGNPCDPNENFGEDQGLIVSSWMPEDGIALERRFGPIRWLHATPKTLPEVVPDRFSI